MFQETATSLNTMSKIEIFYRGDEYYLRCLEEIQAAKNWIYMEQYIFEADEIGRHIFLALDRAKSRGVEVKLLVDGVGSAGSASELERLAALAQIEFRVYHPLVFFRNKRPSLRNAFWGRGLYLFRRVNKRDHRKLLLIDGNKVFMGSCNVSKVHSERLAGTSAWRDTSCFLQLSPESSDLKAFENLKMAFTKSWNSSRLFSGTHLRSFIHRVKGPRPSHHVIQRFRLNNTPFLRFFLLRDLNRRLDKAQKEVFITNAYFLPRKSLLRHLKKASDRGVKVRLLLPEKTDVWFVREAARSLYSRLLKHGVEIYEYQKSVLHAKTLIIDDWATVGSHNLNHRSFLHDLEAEVVFQEPQVVQSLKDQFDLDLKNSRAVTAADLRLTWWPRKLLAHLFYWLRFWL
jgi:cardiolipin synthase